MDGALASCDDDENDDSDDDEENPYGCFKISMVSLGGSTTYCFSKQIL